MDILFFAHNSHQYKYFELIRKSLPFKSKVLRVTFSFCKTSKINIDYKLKEIENKSNNSIYKTFIKFQAPFIYCFYEKMIKKYNPKLVAMWNGIKYPQFILNDLTKKMKIKTIFFENGFLPDTTQVDCKGINFLNSVPRNKEFYENLEYYKKSLPDKLIPRIPKRKHKGDEIDLDRKYIFIPFQVNYDSQIIKFSLWIKSMKQFFDLINEIAIMFDFDFLIKVHPSDKIDYSNFKPNKNVYFVTNPTDELIKNSKAIITINSSVGIESLLFQKKVITVGNAFYNIEGIVQNVKNKNELINILKNIDKWQLDIKLIKNFLGYLYYEYLIPKSWKNPNQEHFNKLLNRINQCI